MFKCNSNAALDPSIASPIAWNYGPASARAVRVKWYDSIRSGSRSAF